MNLKNLKFKRKHITDIDLEHLGKIYPVTIYDKGFKVKQKISVDKILERDLSQINATPEEKAKLYRKRNSQIVRSFNERPDRKKEINYEPVNTENFNEKHKSAKELFGQDQAKLFD